MERLTFDGNFCDIAQCRNVPGGSFCEDGSCSQKKVWERLKQFEDTVRAPELFFKMYGELPLLESAIKHYSSHDRMKELARADKKGRLVVLPCKLGDTVWLTKMFYTQPKKTTPAKVDAIRIDLDGVMFIAGPKRFSEDAIGRTVFLTEQEAEKALAEMEAAK